MDIDPMGAVESDDGNEEESDHVARERRKSHLNNWVAIMVAVLATFMGICKVKDDNIVQAMQQDQAKSVDAWAWYQAKKVRLQAAQIAVDQLDIQLTAAPPAVQTTIQSKIAKYKAVVEKEKKDLDDVQKKAEGFDKDYDRMNFHDDQFDLADALVALSISLFAVTALTQKRWLFVVALVPTFFGVLSGAAGLFNLSIHSNFFAKILGT